MYDDIFYYQQSEYILVNDYWFTKEKAKEMKERHKWYEKSIYALEEMYKSQPTLEEGVYKIPTWAEEWFNKNKQYLLDYMLGDIFSRLLNKVEKSKNFNLI